MSTVKDQHFVPKCYLKLFTNNKELYALNVSGLRKGYKIKPERKTPTQVCYLADYYTIKHQYNGFAFDFSEYSELFIEKDVFKTIENTYSDLVGKFLSAAIDIEDCNKFAGVLTQFKIRNPYWFNNDISKNYIQWLNSAFSEVLQEEKGKNRFPFILPIIQESVSNILLQAQLKDPQTAKKLLLKSLIERNKSDNPNNARIKEAILQFDWVLYEIPDACDATFITSDNPGFSQLPDGTISNTGYRQDYTVFFPLTPKHCLRLCKIDSNFTPNNGRSGLLYKHIPDEAEVKAINHGSMVHITDRVFCVREKELNEIIALFKQEHPSDK